MSWLAFLDAPADARSQPPLVIRRVAAAFAATFCIALLAGTLMPLYGAPASGDSLCLICGQIGGADFVDNILAFAPLGLAASLALGRPATAALLVMLMSGAIEVLQWRIIAGRDASLGDLVANTLGGILGAAIAAYWRPITMPNRPSASRLVALWTILTCLILGAAVWLTQPAPVDLRYRAYWMPNTHGLATPLLDDVLLFDSPIRHGALIEPSDFAPAFSAGELDITLTIQGSYAGSVPIDLFQLANRLERRINVVSVEGNVVFQPLLRATRARFWSPSSHIPGVLTGDESTTTTIRYTTHPGGAQAEWSSGGATQTAEIGYSPIEFWRLLVSDSVIPSRFYPLLALSCAAVLLLPIGYWSGFSRMALGAATGLVPVTVGLLGWPKLAGRPFGGFSEWVALTIVLLLGWLLGRAVRLVVDKRQQT